MVSTASSRHVAVIGAGAAGLSSAWLLSQSCVVTLIEREGRLGGHAHTADVHTERDNPTLAIDTGFIVYNEHNYPNLVEWFKILGVATEESDMSFAVSRDLGAFEYAGGPPLGLLAQPSLLASGRYWSMLRDLLRFYRDAPRQIPQDSQQTLGDFLVQGNYSKAFVDDHLMPFGAAVWSTSRNNMFAYPAAAFIRFCDNHGLLKLLGRPQWRTVSGGSNHYVTAAKAAVEKAGGSILSGSGAVSVRRHDTGIEIVLANGDTLEAEHVVIAAHADQALAMLKDPDAAETTLLGAFEYDQNHAVLHTDKTLMPKRRRAWCSWNYVEQTNDDCAKVSVSYWMNRLQNLNTAQDYFVSLNPGVAPDPNSVIRASDYEHPIFTADTWQAQQHLWSLQGVRNTWFCGAYFGAGFHEDAVQAGFAVAEQLSGQLRPWSLTNPSDRIVVDVAIPDPKTAA